MPLLAGLEHRTAPLATTHFVRARIVKRRTTLLAALVLAACTADLPTAPSEDGVALQAVLPPPPPPPSVMSASLGGGDGRGVSTYVGSYPYSIYSRITFSGLINYSGRTDGYLPGSGSVDAAGILVQNQCHLNLVLSMHHPPAGSTLRAFPGCFYPAAQVGNYVINAVVKGEVYFDRWPGPPGSCSSGVTPCVSYTGSQSVTIEPLEGKLVLAANKTTVPGGGSATIFAKGVLASDPTKLVPLVVREWRFEGQGPVVGPYSTKVCGITTATQCAAQFFQSGHIVVEATVNGVTMTDRIWITVVGGDTIPNPPLDTLPTDTIPTDTIPTDTIPGGGGGGCGAGAVAGLLVAACDTTPAPVLSLKCSPGSITRASQVSCVISATPAAAFVVDSIRSRAGTFAANGPGGQSVSTGGTYVWAGTGLLSSEVAAWATLDSGGTMVKRLVVDSFIVQARAWAELDSLWSAPTVFRHTIDPDRQVHAAPVRLANGAYMMRLGIHVTPSPQFNVADIGTVSTGPNAGLHYLTRGASFQVPPSIYTTPGFIRGAVLLDQNGGSGPGYPRCTRQQWQGPYQAEVERHEGVTRASNSHWGIFLQQLQIRRWNQEFERTVSDGSSPYFLLNDVALRYVDWYDTQVRPLQRALDVQDIQVTIPQRVGCEPDFNYTDQ